MIQVLGLRDWNDKGQVKKRETFFSKGWRFTNIQDVFDTDKVKALLSGIPENEQYNLYFTVADCYEESGRKLKEQWAIPFDIDNLHLEEGNELEVALSAARAGCDALGVPLEECGVVFTGNGVQFFILLNAPIVDENYFDKMREQYGVLAGRIKTKLLERGIEGKVDTSVWSKGRLMRLPLTLNRKPGKPTRQAVILNGTMVAREFDLVKESGVDASDVSGTISDVVLKNYPQPDTKAVCEGCKFMVFCKENPNEVSEPQWYADISVRARLENGRELVHQASQGHKGYNHYETENKIDQALAASGPRTCKSIEQLWDGCKDCEHYGKVTSPIMIKGEDYIGSRDFGFRKRSIKDGKVTPGQVVFMDLVKEFANEHPYKVVNDNDQVVIYNGKHWEFVSTRQIKAWAMDKIRPEPSEAEMNEFVARLKAFNVVKMEELHAQREGYMNFSNCVLNINTREMLLHSPEYGFFNVLPYAYDPRATSPLFDQFLLDIMDGDQVMADTLKEFGGYCISGDSCWLQKSLLLVGDGANGKSVFMEVLGEVVGKDFHSAIPMQGLEKDTLRYQLVNKLFNYSEETSMKALSDSSMFKALTTGGMMTVKQLYAQPYVIANRTKLILSANNMPYSNDTSGGLTRRLAIVHLRKKFEPGVNGHDYFIKDKLLAELPGICNTLMKAYERLKTNRLLSGTEQIEKAVKAYAYDNDSCMMFIENVLTFTEDEEDIVKSVEVYAAYVQMCELYGLKPLSMIGLGRALSKHKGLISVSTTKNNSKFRAYKKIKLNKEY